MVEKPTEEGDEVPDEPVMVEKRVCDVATACSLKYGEFTVNEATEMQLTEDTLNQVSESIINNFNMKMNIYANVRNRKYDTNNRKIADAIQ